MATATTLPDQDAITIELAIAAPPQRVFDAITEPGQLLQWWGQQSKYRTARWEIDLRPGGDWRSHGVRADGSPFQVSGTYLEVDPPHLLVHTWKPSWDGQTETTVRWELTAQGNGTLVRLHHSGFAGNTKSAQDHNDGWQRVLGWMQAFVEQGSTVSSRAS